MTYAWYADENRTDICVDERKQSAIAVHLNEDEDIVIRQQGDDYVDDSCVVILKENIQSVIERLSLYL